jgi:hypothetical protein
MLLKIILVALFVFTFAQTNLPKDFRIIQVDNEEIWIHKDRIQEYQARAGALVNFIDKTETQDLEKPSEVISKFTQDLKFPDKPTQQSVVKKMIEKIDSGHSYDHVTKVVQHLSSYRTRHARTATGAQAVEWLKQEYEKRLSGIENPQRRALFSVRVVKHRGWEQPSLIIKMKGTSDEIVILGGNSLKFLTQNFRTH